MPCSTATVPTTPRWARSAWISATGACRCARAPWVAKPLVQGCGVTRLPITVEGAIRTVAPTAHQSFWVDRLTDANGDHLRAGGDIPEGPAQQLYRAMSDPVRDCGLLLREMLRELGVQVTGAVVTSAAPPATMQLAGAG